MKPYGIVFLIIIMILTGCSLISKQDTQLSQEIQKTIKQAQDNLRAVEGLLIQEKYARDFQEARNALITAETHLQQSHHDQAYLSALRSMAASQRIFQQFYQDTIAPSAQETRVQIEAILGEDPDNPLQEFLPVLSEILDYSDGLELGQHDVEMIKVIKDLEKVTQIGYDTQLTMNNMAGSQISFEPGKYNISDQGKRVLQTFCEALITDKRKYITLYPDKTPIIKLKIVGYADQIDFREETIDELMRDTSAQIPESQPERRQFLNQRLSELRAKKVSEYVSQFIPQVDQSNPQAQIELEIVGLGEEIPPGVSRPYPLSDPRRRVCKIYGYITGQ